MKPGKILTLILCAFIPVLLLVVMGQSMVQAAEGPDPGQARALSDRSSVETAVSDPSLAPLVDEADLGIEKAGDPVSVIAGERLTYTLTISNNGTISATNVVVTDSVPLSLTIVDASTSYGEPCSSGSNDLVCSMGDLLVGASGWVTIVTTVDPGAPASLHNVAGVRSDATESITDNNIDTLDTSVFTSADLSIGKSDEPDPIQPGEKVTYTLTITNDGPSDAVGVVVTDTLPLSTTLVDATPSQGPACTTGAEVTCELGPLPADDTATVTIVVVADENFTGVLQNDAEVASSTSDPDEGNNFASEETTVDPLVDLTIAKSGDRDPVLAGTVLTYSLVVTNSGDFVASNVVVTDALPAETTVITATASQGSCVLGSTVVCTLGDLAADTTASIVIKVLVDSSATDEVVNTAETSTDTSESNEDNNEAGETTTVNTSADLSLGKAAFPDPAVAGGLLTYSILVYNEGPSDATGVTVADTLPLSTTYISADVIQDPAIIHSIDTSRWIPSSPDPAGITYVPVDDRLMVSDSELDEPPNKRDDNLFESTRQGALIRVTSTTGFSDEPSGLAYDPDSDTLFVSDDAEALIWVVKRGPDGIFGTGDDIYDSFSTAAFGNPVPEGLAFDTDRGHLISVDGSFVVRSVFDIDPVDGIFGNGNDVVTSWSYDKQGIADPEGIAYHPDTQTVWIGDHGNPRVVEFTIGGTKLTTIDLTPDFIRVSGLTIAPSSANPNVLSLYITDRGVDNNVDPKENDGKIYELVFPSAPSPGGDCDNGAVVDCDVDDIPAGGWALVSIVVRVDLLADGSLTNSAEVDAATPDGEGGNNSDTIETPIVTIADLNLTKIDDPDPVAAGERLTYTLVVSNSGPSIAYAVTLEDSLPPSTTISSTHASHGTGCDDLQNLECLLGDLLPSTAATVTVIVDVAAGAPPSLTNVAEVKSVTFDDWPYDNFVTEVTTVTATADLTLAKASWPNPVRAGETLTYTLVVTNLGPSDALGVVLTDTLPGGVNLVSADASQGTCGTGSAPVCDLGDIPLNTTASVTIVVTVTPSVSQTLLNVADVAAVSVDPVPDNNHYEQLTAVELVADVSVDKVGAPEPVYAGSLLTYTLTIANAGPSDATNVVVTDTLPGAAKLVEADAAQGPGCLVNGQVVCQLGMIPADQQVLVTITTSLSPTLSPQSLVNEAVVSSDAYDPDETNNRDVFTSTLETAADLAVTKASSPDPVTAGKNLTYTLTVQNLGPSNASGILLTDTLPIEATFVYSDVSQGVCSGTTQIVCNIGDLSVLESAEITIVVTVDAGASGVITNTAEVKGEQQDLDTENNQKSLITSVNREGSLPLSKTDDPDPVIAGTVLTYSLVVTSAGPSHAVGVVLTDTLPEGVQFLTVTQSVGGCDEDAGVVTCQLGDLDVGTHATVEIVVFVNTDTLGPINNKAEVSADGATPTEVNQNTTVNSSADLSVNSRAEPSPVMVGGLITFTIDVTNSGPSMARMVVVENTLPADTSFNSSPDCVLSLGQIDCDLGDIDLNESVSTYFVVEVADDAVGVVESEATVESDTHDPDRTNNHSIASTKIMYPPVFLPLIMDQ